MKALYLTGGSFRGIYQIGALQGLYDQDEWVPDIVFGTSIGAINGAALLNHFNVLEENKPSTISREGIYVEALDAVSKIWKEEITEPDAIIKKRSKFKLLIELLGKKWNGYYDLSPFLEIFERNTHNLAVNKSLYLYTAYVDMVSGEVIYTAPHHQSRKYVQASGMIPIAMPHVQLGNFIGFDGGLRDIAPTKLLKDIYGSIDEIVLISCQGKDITLDTFDPGDLVGLVGRTVDIILNEVVENDIKTVLEINNILRLSTGFKASMDKQVIPVKIIRPEAPLPNDIENFNQMQMLSMFQAGYNAGKNSQWP